MKAGRGALQSLWLYKESLANVSHLTLLFPSPCPSLFFFLSLFSLTARCSAFFFLFLNFFHPLPQLTLSTWVLLVCGTCVVWYSQLLRCLFPICLVRLKARLWCAKRFFTSFSSFLFFYRFIVFLPLFCFAAGYFLFFWGGAGCRRPIWFGLI